jgi:hypothetical protein
MPASPTLIEQIRSIFRRFQNTLHRIEKAEAQDYEQALQSVDIRKADQIRDQIQHTR